MKSMTRILIIVLTSTILFVSGCKSGKSGEKIKIGFLLKTMQEERYQKDKQAFEERAKELGFEVIFDSCNNSEQTQLAKMENMLIRGVKVIVLQPVNTGTAGILVKKAHKKGVRVVGYDSLLVNGPLDVHIMQDSWSVGKLQAEAMIAWLKKKRGAIKGNIVLIKGQPGDSNAIAMSSGVLDTIKKYKGLKLLLEQSHEGWSTEKANATALNALTRYKNEIDAFICNNSGLARGVIAALKTQGLARATKVFVAGSDSDIINIRYVANGIQAVEIFKKIKPLARMAATVAYKLAINPKKKISDIIKYDMLLYNKFMKVPTIVTPIVLVTKDNIMDTVVKSGFHTKEAIFGK